MKIILWLVLSISSCFCSAETIFKIPEPNDSYGFVAKKAAAAGLSDVKIDFKQTFDVFSKGKKTGTLIQGKGWLRDVHPVCFIGWETDRHPDAFFMQTMGAGDWETVDCNQVESVGLLSHPDDRNIKIAVIYKIDARGQHSQDYVVLGLKNSEEVFYDEHTTEIFQNAYLKDIVSMRKKYDKIKSE